MGRAALAAIVAAAAGVVAGSSEAGGPAAAAAAAPAAGRAAAVGGGAGRLGSPRPPADAAPERALFAADGAHRGAPPRENATASGGLSVVSEAVSSVEPQAAGAERSLAGALPPWYIQYGVTPMGPPTDHGTWSSVSFTPAQQAQFGVDADGIVVNQAQFDAATAALQPALSPPVQFQQQVGGMETFGAASPGCQSCCTTGQCGQAYMGQQPGVCCSVSPAPMCCPQGATCMNGQCAAGQQQPYAYGGGGGGGGYPRVNPISGLLRLISQNMMLIWIILAILGCLGIGGPAVHYAQMALCGMSLFNCLCPGAANDLYGQGGGGGMGGYSYGPPGGF